MISRDTLLDGSFVAKARAALAAGAIDMVVRPDAEVESTRIEFLAQRPNRTEIWVFGYGSLMWNPAIKYVEHREATLAGWRRSFCIWARAGRGSPERPGLTLGLEPGGEMHGVAFRLPPGEEELELQLVWRREMFSDSYVPRWVTIDIQGRAVEAVTFVVDRDKSRYTGHLSESEIVSAISSAQGILGTGVDYLAQTIDSLDKLGLHDGDLERIWNLVKMASVR